MADHPPRIDWKHRAEEAEAKLNWYQNDQEKFWADKYHELNGKRDRAERQNAALLAAGGKVVSLWEAMSQLRPERPWGFANDELDAAEVERMVELLEDLSAAIAQATTTEEGDGGE